MAIGTPTSIGSTDTSGNSATIVLTTTATVNVGQMIAVAIMSSVNDRVLSSVADSAGNTYTIDNDGPALTNSLNTYIASTMVTTQLASGGTITGTFATSLASTRKIAAVQVSGIDTGTRFDGQNEKSESGAAGTAWETNTVTTTVPDTFLFAASGTLVSKTATTTSPALELFDLSGNARGFTAAYDIKSSTGTYEIGGTWSATGIYYAIIVAYRGAAAAAAVLPVVNQAALVPTGPSFPGDWPGRE